MAGNVNGGRPVLEAGVALRKQGRNQLLRAQALNPCRDLAPAHRARDRQCARRDMTEPDLEHGGIEQGLDQSGSCGPRVYQREQVIERKTMARVQRQQTGIVDGGGLNLEVELLTKLLAESEAEGAIQPD